MGVGHGRSRWWFDYSSCFGRAWVLYHPEEKKELGYWQHHLITCDSVFFFAPFFDFWMRIQYLIAVFPIVETREHKIWKANFSKKHGYLLMSPISVYLQPPSIVNTITWGHIWTAHMVSTGDKKWFFYFFTPDTYPTYISKEGSLSLSTCLHLSHV